MREKISLVVTAALLVFIGGGAFVDLASEGRWLYAAGLGLAVPLGTAVEWYLARSRSKAEGDVAERFALLVAIAILLGASL